MIYYKVIKEEKITEIGTNDHVPRYAEEITEEEYLELQVAFEERQKTIADYVSKVQNGEITLEEVPEEYCAEVEAIINVPEPVDPKQALIDEIIAEVNA